MDVLLHARIVTTNSAMRVSPCDLIAVTLEEAVALARASAEITHNHPEGILGAEATAASIFLARVGKSKEKIGDYICDHFNSSTADDRFFHCISQIGNVNCYYF